MLALCRALAIESDCGPPVGKDPHALAAFIHARLYGKCNPRLHHPSHGVGVVQDRRRLVECLPDAVPHKVATDGVAALVRVRLARPPNRVEPSQGCL